LLLIRGGMEPSRALSQDRAIVPLALMFGSGAVMLFGYGVITLQSGGGGAAFYVSLVGFLGFVLGTALFALVRAFNQPKVLVPPHLRREPGILGLRRAQKRRNARYKG
jgi:hypothetical protein